MDLLQIIRLIKKNIFLLIGVPILLSVAVYYFTGKLGKKYQSEEVIYTGFTTGYSIESANSQPVNYYASSAKFDNMINLLKSRKVDVEASLMLLAQDLSLKHPDPAYISNENYDRLQKMIPRRVKDLVVVNNVSGAERVKTEQNRNVKNSHKNLFNNNFNNHTISDSNRIFTRDPIVPPGVKKSDFQKTVFNFNRYYSSNDTNYIYGLLHYGASKLYSISYISKIQVARVSNSDLVKLTFISNDPGICQQTLRTITKAFMDNYRSMRINETDRVVRYFQHQVDSAKIELANAEDRLLLFNERNNIINYGEQSKAIAVQKSDLDAYYQNQQIKLSEASSVLQQLETQMTARDSIYLKSDVLTQKSKELADVTEKIVLNQLAKNYNKKVAAQLKILTKKQQKLRADIKSYVDQLYLYGHSTQGIPLKSLLDAWFTNTINYAEAKAALVVLAQRRMDFIRTYQKMAPMGAMLTRIEREIKISEQTYLGLLTSLNAAKMTQQNQQMSTNMRVVDPPFFPLTPNASKRKYIVISAGMAGFFIIGLIIFMMELYDTSTRYPSRVVEQTGMPLAGAYPYLYSKHVANELSQISSRLIEMIIQNIKLNLNKLTPEVEKPYLILIFSTQNGVGKSLLAHKIITQMRFMGNKVLFLNYRSDDDEVEEEDFNHSYHYTVKNDFIDLEDLQQLVDSRFLRKNNTPYDYIFLEIPSIVYHTYPIKLLSEIDLALFVIKSNDHFSKADKNAIKPLQEVATNNFLVVLNEVELVNLEELLSMVPKTRTGLLNKFKTMFSYAAQYKIVVKKKEVKNRG